MKNSFNLKIISLFWLALVLGCSDVANTNQTERNSVVSSSPTPANTAQQSGWKPQEACAFLSDIDGLQTRGYKKLYSDEDLSCSSDYKKLGSEFPLPNTIAYYANGNSQTVNELKLVINVNVKDKGKDAQATLADYSQKLTEKALGEKMPQEAKNAILAGKAGKWTLGKAQVEVKREDWETGKGYNVHYILRKNT